MIDVGEYLLWEKFYEDMEKEKYIGITKVSGKTDLDNLQRRKDVLLIETPGLMADFEDRMLFVAKGKKNLILWKSAWESPSRETPLGRIFKIPLETLRKENLSKTIIAERYTLGPFFDLKEKPYYDLKNSGVLD